ncbi:hypothetical protein QL285_082555 [Trifolium repens]|nr:hypothetical protein QL285_082555 [Trifolium repens]
MSLLTKKTIDIATKSMSFYTSSLIISTASFSTAYERAESWPNPSSARHRGLIASARHMELIAPARHMELRAPARHRGL